MEREFLKLGVQLTSQLQISLKRHDDLMIGISKVFDPRYAYTVFFPILFHLNRPAGIKLLWTAAIAEWLNHVFKWILFGERPYWWALQNEHLWGNDSSAPILEQFPNTCETGPGSPSGHVMITGAVLYVFLHGLLELQGKKRNHALHFIGWTVYIVTMISIATSRVFLAAHFPHQCVAGLVLGMILGSLANKVLVSEIRFSLLIGMSVAILVFTFAAYYALIGLGVDPDWSLPLAQKWCKNPDWVHLNTNPFYMMWRYTGTILGIGMALGSSLYRDSVAVNFSLRERLQLAVVSILAAFITTGLIPEGPVLAVYCSAFVIHSVIPLIVTGLVPSVATTIGAVTNAAKED